MTPPAPPAVPLHTWVASRALRSDAACLVLGLGCALGRAPPLASLLACHLLLLLLAPQRYAAHRTTCVAFTRLAALVYASQAAWASSSSLMLLAVVQAGLLKLPRRAQSVVGLAEMCCLGIASHRSSTTAVACLPALYLACCALAYRWGKQEAYKHMLAHHEHYRIGWAAWLDWQRSRGTALTHRQAPSGAFVADDDDHCDGPSAPSSSTPPERADTGFSRSASPPANSTPFAPAAATASSDGHSNSTLHASLKLIGCNEAIGQRAGSTTHEVWRAAAHTCGALGSTAHKHRPQATIQQPMSSSGSSPAPVAHAFNTSPGSSTPGSDSLAGSDTTQPWSHECSSSQGSRTLQLTGSNSQAAYPTVAIIGSCDGDSANYERAPTDVHLPLAAHDLMLADNRRSLSCVIDRATTCTSSPRLTHSHSVTSEGSTAPAGEQTGWGGTQCAAAQPSNQHVPGDKRSTPWDTWGKSSMASCAAAQPSNQHVPGDKRSPPWDTWDHVVQPVDGGQQASIWQLHPKRLPALSLPPLDVSHSETASHSPSAATAPATPTVPPPVVRGTYSNAPTHFVPCTLVEGFAWEPPRAAGCHAMSSPAGPSRAAGCAITALSMGAPLGGSRVAATSNSADMYMPPSLAYKGRTCSTLVSLKVKQHVGSFEQAANELCAAVLARFQDHMRPHHDHHNPSEAVTPADPIELPPSALLTATAVKGCIQLLTWVHALCGRPNGGSSNSNTPAAQAAGVSHAACLAASDAVQAMLAQLPGDLSAQPVQHQLLTAPGSTNTRDNTRGARDAHVGVVAQDGAPHPPSAGLIQMMAVPACGVLRPDTQHVLVRLLLGMSTATLASLQQCAPVYAGTDQPAGTAAGSRASPAGTDQPAGTAAGSRASAAGAAAAPSPVATALSQENVADLRPGLCYVRVVVLLGGVVLLEQPVAIPCAQQPVAIPSLKGSTPPTAASLPVPPPSAAAAAALAQQMQAAHSKQQTQYCDSLVAMATSPSRDEQVFYQLELAVPVSKVWDRAGKGTGCAELQVLLLPPLPSRTDLPQPDVRDLTCLATSSPAPSLSTSLLPSPAPAQSPPGHSIGPDPAVSLPLVLGALTYLLLPEQQARELQHLFTVMVDDFNASRGHPVGTPGDAEAAIPLEPAAIPLEPATAAITAATTPAAGLNTAASIMRSTGRGTQPVASSTEGVSGSVDSPGEEQQQQQVSAGCVSIGSVAEDVIAELAAHGLQCGTHTTWPGARPYSTQSSKYPDAAVFNSCTPSTVASCSVASFRSASLPVPGSSKVWSPKCPAVTHSSYHSDWHSGMQLSPEQAWLPDASQCSSLTPSALMPLALTRKLPCSCRSCDDVPALQLPMFASAPLGQPFELDSKLNDTTSQVASGAPPLVSLPLPDHPSRTCPSHPTLNQLAVPSTCPVSVYTTGTAGRSSTEVSTEAVLPRLQPFELDVPALQQEGLLWVGDTPLLTPAVEADVHHPPGTDSEPAKVVTAAATTPRGATPPTQLLVATPPDMAHLCSEMATARDARGVQLAADELHVLMSVWHAYWAPLMLDLAFLVQAVATKVPAGVQPGDSCSSFEAGPSGVTAFGCAGADQAAAGGGAPVLVRSGAGDEGLQGNVHEMAADLQVFLAEARCPVTAAWVAHLGVLSSQSLR